MKPILLAGSVMTTAAPATTPAPSPPAHAPAAADPPRPADRRRLFAAWLLAFYASWTAAVATAGLWPTVRGNWQIGVAMAGGSFVGGSSPIAGGTVGFPVLVYLFNHPANLGRTFCLAIQSIGMVSASLYILTHRRKVEWRLLKYALPGAAMAMPVGMYAVAPHVSDVAVKVLFSVIYASFGLLHLARLRAIVANQGHSRTRFAADPAIGLGVGILGGLIASVLGVGADILFYGVLVLLYHSDIKIAIPSAVILMAFTSVIGAACTLAGALAWPATREALAGVFPYWLAAAPVVVVGGPLGSLVSRLASRRVIPAVVAFLCLGQYGLTCYHEHIVGRSFLLAGAGVVALNAALHALFLVGRRALPPQA